MSDSGVVAALRAFARETGGLDLELPERVDRAVGGRDRRALVAAVDVGSIAGGNFAWSATWEGDAQPVGGGLDPETLTELVGRTLRAGHRLALGFEAPLVLPVPLDPVNLGKARAGEQQRPWSAGAGASVLGTGLVQLAWVLRELAPCTATTVIDRWSADVPLLLWEAFVSAEDKPRGTHQDDAEAAVRGFLLRRDEDSVRIDTGPHAPMNLAALVAVFAGLAIESDEVRGPLLVVRGRPQPS